MSLVDEAARIVRYLSKTSKTRLLLEQLVPKMRLDEANLSIADRLVTENVEWPVYYSMPRLYGCAHCEGVRPGQGADLELEQVGHSDSCSYILYRKSRGMIE